MSKCIPFKNGILTVATTPDKFRVGDVYKCVRSRVEGRTGKRFTIKDKNTAEWLDFLDSMGDQFEKVESGSGRSITVRS